MKNALANFDNRFRLSHIGRDTYGMRRVHQFAAATLLILVGCAGPGLLAGEPLGRQLGRALEEIKKDCVARGAPPFGPGSGQYNDTSCLMFTLKPWEPGDTPESAFAHDIKLPSPHDKPKDVYKATMSSEEYFKALCEAEAGEWVFRRVEEVQEIRFERPFRQLPFGYQRVMYYVGEPGEVAYTEPEDYFVKPPLGKYRYLAYRLFTPLASSDQTVRYRVVERSMQNDAGGASNIVTDVRSTAYKTTETLTPIGKYGVVWRGVKRKIDLDHAIEGQELIIFEIESRKPLALRRVYFQYFQDANSRRQDPRFAYARGCPKELRSDGPRTFIESVLLPTIAK